VTFPSPNSQPRRPRNSPKRPARMLRTALAAAVFAAVAVVPAQAASASVLWTADAEHPVNKEWANVAAEAGRVTRVTSPVAQGGYAYSIELRPGDNPGGYGERAELGMGNPTAAGFPLFNEGDERWIAFQVYLPDDYPINFRSWDCIMQLKQLGSLGTPALSMGVERGAFTLKNSATNHEDSQQTPIKWSGPAVADRWVSFVLHVKFSPSDSVGFVELFGDLDGTGIKPLMGKTFMHTMKTENGVAVPSQSRIGQYRDSEAGAGVSHIYFDGYTIATDRASAEGNAFAPAGVAAPASIAAIDDQLGEASASSQGWNGSDAQGSSRPPSRAGIASTGSHTSKKARHRRHRRTHARHRRHAHHGAAHPTGERHRAGAR